MIGSARSVFLFLENCEPQSLLRCDGVLHNVTFTFEFLNFRTETTIFEFYFAGMHFLRVQVIYDSLAVVTKNDTTSTYGAHTTSNPVPLQSMNKAYYRRG